MKGIELRSSTLAEKVAFSCSADGVIECTGFSIYHPQHAVPHRDFCGHWSGQARSGGLGVWGNVFVS